jgi:hypothetical protein
MLPLHQPSSTLNHLSHQLDTAPNLPSELAIRKVTIGIKLLNQSIPFLTEMPSKPRVLTHLPMSFPRLPNQGVHQTALMNLPPTRGRFAAAIELARRRRSSPGPIARSSVGDGSFVAAGIRYGQR